MADFSVAFEGLRAEETYLREMAAAQSSLSTAVVSLPSQVPNWGPWDALRPTIESAFTEFNETVSTANEGLNATADLIRDTANAYLATESALTVQGES